jgi:MFS-type transporter involved in bile tolerance (Atg22 family)
LFWNVELIAQEISVVSRLSGCRLGNVRAISRRYIADHVPVKELTRASAAFVSASALGMATGPALAGLLNNIKFKVKQNMFFNLLILSLLLSVVEDLHYSHIQFNLFLLAKEGTTIMSWS